MFGLAASLLGGSAGAAAAANTTGAAATSGGIKVAYFDQWSIYQNAFYLKNLDTEGIAGKLNYLVYDFENIDPTNLTCFEATKATDPDPAGENDPNAGDGAEDSFADYQKSFDSSISVDGTSDVYNQPIAGNFHQLQELKKKYPNLKILLSLGGWTYSKYFSDAAATSASRQKFVSSCIDMFIKGNLPVQGGYGGAGTAAGIFDGFDIDWEYPGAPGHLGNHYSPADTADYTALLAEFRNQLNAQGAADGHTYALSAAVPSGQDKISKIQTNQIGQYLNFADAMTYDMYGAWNATGPTDEQDPLYANPNSPESKVAPGNETYSIDNAVRAWTVGDSQYGIPGGFPASKLTLGIPFYYRGWTGVPAGSGHGLYQSATGGSPGQTDSGNVPGVAMYKELNGVVNNASDTFWDPVTDSAYFYDGNNFYGGESLQSIQARADYAHCNGLGGFMMFSLYDLDPAATLFNAAVNDINGSAGTCPSPSGSPSGSTSPSSSASGSPSASPSTSPSSSPSSSPSTSPSTSPSSSPTGSGGSGALTNGGFESGSLSPWTCQAGSTVVSSPVHTGSYALQVTPSSSTTGECDQTVTLKPNTAYTLTGWVTGPYAYIGVSGGASASTWSSTTSWNKLTVPFTTGSSGTVTVYVHGWYAQGNVGADDFSLS
jgi:chitinase